MAWGDGSLYRRKDGRWCGQLSVGGTRRYVYGRSREEALAKLAALREGARQGLPPRPAPRVAEPQAQGQGEQGRPEPRLPSLGQVSPAAGAELDAEAVAAEGGKLDVEVLTGDPARINVQMEVPTWLIAMWDIGYRARGYDGTFARWIVELLTLHFVRCRGLSLGIIARTSATE
jgi:hypothetical protein